MHMQCYIYMHMQTINVRELQRKVRHTLSVAQGENVVITRHGKPTALLVGLAHMDWEAVFEFIGSRYRRPRPKAPEPDEDRPETPPTPPLPQDEWRNW